MCLMSSVILYTNNYMGNVMEVIGIVMPSQYVTEGIYRIFYGGTLADPVIWYDLFVIVIISLIIYVIGLKLYDK